MIESPEQPYNILTAIDHLEKESNGFRKMYDVLCEFTHPNYPGVMGTYGWIDETEHILHLDKRKYQEFSALSAVEPLTICLILFKEYYDALSEELKIANDYFEQHGKTEKRK